MKKNKKSGSLYSIVAVVLLLAGLTVFFYPTVSDQINRYRQHDAIRDYKALVSELDKEECSRMLAEAEAYNARLLTRPAGHQLTEEERREYGSLLKADKKGVMGYVEIPKIHVSLPIYHGTDEEVLKNAIGHIESSSLPVGGTGTHAVISGHRGLPSAKLFTDIDQLAEGDRFMIRVLDRTMTYEVDQIHVVLPEEMDDLKIDPEEDYCTLATCTPYGVNTHRLLVRGTRVENDEAETAYETEPFKVSPILLIPLVCAPGLLIVLIILLMRTGKRGKGSTGDGKNTEGK